MKICKYCGSEVANTESVCTSCGAKEFKKKCDNCSNIFEEGEFCPRCGIRFGIEIKKCPKCKTEYFTNACPNCGYSGIAEEKPQAPSQPQPAPEPPKKSKTWLWVLGWIFIFPVPLTILIARNEKMGKFLKGLIITLAWVVYIALLITSGVTNQQNEQAKKETEKTPEINITVETEKETDKSTQVSEIKLTAEKNTIFIGDELTLKVAVTPESQKNAKLTWKSSNESVATVSEEGTVKGLSNGTTTISVSTQNGVADWVDIVVVSSKTMNVKTETKKNGSTDIGDEWSFQYKLDGETSFNTKEISVGDTLEFYVRVTGSGTNPAVGENTLSYKVTEDDLRDGFSVPIDVTVSEIEGENKGKETKFTVTYTFTN